jgi:cyclopropane fatty-acyl-phospholipid synthase-like methyltransferase
VTPFDPEAVRAFEHARWQAAAGVYEATFARATAPFVAALLDAACVGRGTRMLDIACGPGFVASAGRARGAVAWGLDFSPAMLAVARARDAAVRFDQGDAEALPYGDADFDAVVANFGIHHVPRPLMALREAHRVLRDGGRVAFSFWAEPGENIAWKLVLDAVARHGDRTAVRAPAPGGGFGTTAQCADALREAGFDDCATCLVHAIWQHRDPRALVMALRAGTARMAALLDAQRDDAMTAIVADIAKHAECYRNADGIAVPIAAVIASGQKS